MKQNIIFDFTQGVEEQVEVAVMPAKLAVKLLKEYVNSLVKASVDEIVGEFIDNLRAVKKDGLPVVIDVAREWVDERTLIHNISTNNWNAYAVEQEVVKPEELPVKDEPHDENTAGI